ncbi:MAG: NADH-quinone oxidoreductase subunit M [Puniceicoccales bacterium]|jgi:NADH-quinone oxidoreductase subunit M|nr:NADH-quinone oxidoreductase subunit M [Puniceicoccales bacterium]
MPDSELLLPAAIAAPLVAGLLLVVSGRHVPVRLQALLALAGFAVPCVSAGLLWANFSALADPATGYAATTTLPLGIASLGVSLALGVNGVSLPLFVLAAIVGFAAGLQALQRDAPAHRHAYLGLLLFMLAGALGVFASVDIFFFHFFYELALVPAFILILQWGGIGRRTAAIQMAVYLTIGAMLALAGAVLLVVKSGAGTFHLAALKTALAAAPLAPAVSSWVFGLLLAGFGILAALFPFHSWAPSAYTEAPAPVSMLHAGVLKTFGLYGLIQIAAPLAPAGLAAWAPWLFWLALGNVLIVGFAALGQRHLKELVAYASVAQTGLCFLGIYAISLGKPAVAGAANTAAAGAGAAVLLMFAHGLSVAALFALTRYVSRRTHTLEIHENGGLAKRAPVLAAFFAAATMASIGLPGFANFWGELGVLTALAKLPAWQIALAAAGVVLVAVYMLRAFAAVFLGEESEAVKKAAADIREMNWAERLTVGLLLAASLAVGFWPRLLSDSLNAALGGK